jgi:hypothetical protein
LSYFIPDVDLFVLNGNLCQLTRIVILKENSVWDMLYEPPEKSIGRHGFMEFLAEKLFNVAQRIHTTFLPGKVISLVPAGK